MQPIHEHAESFYRHALELHSRVELSSDVPDDFKERHASFTSPAYAAAAGHNPLGIMHPVPTETVSSPVAVAEIEHGRWLVRCPFEKCRSAQHAPATDHRFFCARCRNEQAGHQYIPVRWPSEDMVEKVERVLLLRPDVETRNWRPGETLAHLRSENKEHGLPTG